MNDRSPQNSVKLFFQSFAKHLERIRDDGQDANQAYRAQILMGQLQQFEKAVYEHGSQPSGSSMNEMTLLGLLEINNLSSLLIWIEQQQTVVKISGCFYLNEKGEWETLMGSREFFPRRRKVAVWLRPGLLGKLDEAKTAYIVYTYGQPRLLFVFTPSDEAKVQVHQRFSLFVARLLPLAITSQVKLPLRPLLRSVSLIANDVGFLELLALVEQAAKKDVSVLLEGESGTGKEVVADFIHCHSTRYKKKLVAVNCAAIPSGLIESELFGHEKGAFTGAYNRQIGRVEEADGGTLFLDEIGEMELAMQAKLLRFLQLHEFHRVGGKQKIKVDVRIVAATNRNLKQQVADGKFREDLYYRLSVMPFSIPPLRQRVDDIVPLFQFFLKKYSAAFRIAQPAVEMSVYQLLVSYSFPGNVRELENLVQNILVVSQGRVIQPAHFPAVIQKVSLKGPPLLDKNGKCVIWHRTKSYRRTFRLRKRMRPATSTAPSGETHSWERDVPRNNEELKVQKQLIQDFASKLTLDLEKRFLERLLEKSGGSMPKASTMGCINRTLLYKMIDRTKDLD